MNALVEYHGRGMDWIGGWRLCVILRTGRLYVHLFEVERLKRYKVLLRDLKRTTRETTATPSRTARVIRRIAARYKRCDVGYPKKAVREALRVLKGD